MNDHRNVSEHSAVGGLGRFPWRLLGVALCWCLLGLWIGGCGAGMGGQSAREPDEAPEAVSDATARFDQAEQDLRDTLLATGQDLFEESGAYEDLPPGQPGMAPPSPAPPAMGRAHQSQAARNRCSRACRALASMQRSADRLCSLAGEDDPQCENVRHRVRAARRLVRQWCSDCSALFG